jgi:GT2 family glycosyltransferase
MHLQVAVVVVSFNTRDLLLNCVASVFESTQGRSIELVIVDNASEDNSYEAVREAFPQAGAIRNSSNLGFGAACNQGIRATTARLILLLNSDAVLTAPAFHTLCDYLERNERCGAAGCRLIDAAGDEVTNTRNFLTPFNQVFELSGMESGLRRLKRTHQPNLDRNLIDCTVDWIDGACLMLKRDALDEVGLFDERFFMYSEDEDLCFRLKKLGWLVCFCAAGTAVHHGAASSSLNRIEMLRYFYSSQLLFLSIHRNDRSAFLYAVLMKMALLLKKTLLPDSRRRKIAGEQLLALKEAWATRDRNG